MKLRYVVGVFAVVAILVACTEKQKPVSETADKATTEQVAKEAELAAQNEPAQSDTDEPKADDKTPESEPVQDDKADPAPDGELKAEDRVSEDQKY
ncbi:MAG: hypothetical protein Q3971_03540 [Moraxella sp.]|nr:hypothetical protein [Moraxella sp.]